MGVVLRVPTVDSDPAYTWFNCRCYYLQAASTRYKSSWTKACLKWRDRSGGHARLPLPSQCRGMSGTSPEIFTRDWFAVRISTENWINVFFFVQRYVALLRVWEKELDQGVRDQLTFPAPEQFGHLSVLGADKGWSPSLNVETGSVSTRAPVLEQRAQARYPTSHEHGTLNI